MKKFGQSAVLDKIMSGGENGHQCVGVKSSAGKRKFGQGEVRGKYQEKVIAQRVL